MKSKWNPRGTLGDGPKYLALARVIEEAITSGQLTPGDRLPSNRELSQTFGVTVATVTKAMSAAARKGLVEAQVGSGTYVLGNPPQGNSTELYELSLNVLPTQPIEKELESLFQELPQRTLAESLFSRGSYICAESHAKQAEIWMRSFGAQANATNILLTVGAHQGLLAAFHALLSPGDTAICENLTYTGIKRIAAYRHVSLLGAACDSQGMIPDSLEQLLRDSDAKVVVLIPTLHNPTTVTMSAERRSAIAKVCKKFDAYIIEDGINMPLSNDGLAPVASYAPERSIFLTGFSKCIASGFRLGYAVAPFNLLPSLHEALVSTQWVGPGFYVEAASLMLKSGLADHCTNLHRQEASRRHALASRLLKGVHDADGPCYHAWVDAPAGWSSEDFATHVLRLGVRVSPAAHFSVDESLTPQAYRISLGACEHISELEAALRQLATININNHTNFETLV